MKVLIMSHLYPNISNPINGIFVARQVKELTNQGCEVRVISPLPWVPPLVGTRNRNWSLLNTVPCKEERDGVMVHYPRFPLLPNKWGWFLTPYLYYWGVKRLVTEIKQSFDFQLLHAHTVMPDGYGTMLLARKFNVPFVVTVHGYDLNPYRLAHPHWRRTLQTVMVKAAKTVYVSGYLKNIAETKLGSSGNSLVLHNGISFPPPRVEPSPKKGEEVNILSVANLIPRKGIDVLIKAFAELRHDHPCLTLTIIGDGPERQRLEQLIQFLGLHEQVTLLGRQPQDIVSQEMERCDLFCLPSWDEGFGVVYLEAMAYGKPVIGCQGEGIEDCIVGGVNGFLVPSKEVQPLTDVLGKAVGNKRLREQVGQSGLKTVMEGFTSTQKGRVLWELYRSLH